MISSATGWISTNSGADSYCCWRTNLNNSGGFSSCSTSQFRDFTYPVKYLNMYMMDGHRLWCGRSWFWDGVNKLLWNRLTFPLGPAVVWQCLMYCRLSQQVWVDCWEVCYWLTYSVSQGEPRDVQIYQNFHFLLQEWNSFRVVRSDFFCSCFLRAQKWSEQTRVASKALPLDWFSDT